MALKSTPQFGPAAYGPIHEKRQAELAKQENEKLNTTDQKKDRAAKAREVLAQKRALGLVGKKKSKKK